MYTITLENSKTGKKIVVKSFASKLEAVRERKEMCKKYSLTRQKGFYSNVKKYLELSENF